MIDVVKTACGVVGGSEVLARTLDCTRQALSQWRKVPRGRVLEIEEATEGKVSRFQLRPDLFKKPDAA